MMFKQFDRRRRNGKIARLPVALRDSVDKMLLAGATYREIVQFLRENDVELSRQAVCNYAPRSSCAWHRKITSSCWMRCGARPKWTHPRRSYG